MPARHRTLPLAFCCCALALSCRSEESERRVEPLPRHAAEAQKLRTLMAGMEAQMHETWPPEIAPLKEQQARKADEARFGQVARAASQLANAAHAISDAVPVKVLDGPDRQQFIRLAAELESRSRGLAMAANQHNEGDMETILARVRSTCRDCHSQFRDISGPRLQWGE